MFQGIKRNATDKYFSDIVRARSNYTCERCLRSFELQKEILDCSHFYSRKNRRVRWNFDNASSLCRGCHFFFGENPREHTEFMLEKLGQERFDLLTLATQRPLNSQKIDEKMIRLGLKKEWQEMQKKIKSQIFGAR